MVDRAFVGIVESYGHLGQLGDYVVSRLADEASVLATPELIVKDAVLAQLQAQIKKQLNESDSCWQAIGKVNQYAEIGMYGLRYLHGWLKKITHGIRFNQPYEPVEEEYLKAYYSCTPDLEGPFDSNAVATFIDRRVRAKTGHPTIFSTKTLTQSFAPAFTLGYIKSKAGTCEEVGRFTQKIIDAYAAADAELRALIPLEGFSIQPDSEPMISEAK